MNKKGFTIAEIAVVVALLAVAALLMYSFFGQGLKLFTYESEAADKQMNLRVVLSDITNRARLADPSAITYDSNTLTVGSDSYKLTGNQIKRNGAVIANGITAFSVEISSGMLSITITNTAGTSISTSISLSR